MNPAGTASEAATRATAIAEKARSLGFEETRITDFTPLAAQQHYEAWLDAGMNGGMHYLASAKHRGRRADPTQLLKNLRSVVVVAMCHPPASAPARDARLGRIARYAAGEDYHRVMRDRMRQLEVFVRSLHEGSHALWYADTGAILERAWAERAGIGWTGKHAGVLSRTLGSWFLIGVVLVDYELRADPPYEREHCGTCDRCLAACPTGAIVAPYRVDARLCISYLTIEHRGPIPIELRPAIGDWVFGCDVCQEVCPWNRFAPPAREARLHARELEGWTLERFLELDEASFGQLFEASPIRRAGRAGFLRNVCVALGNRGDASAVPALMRALSQDSDSLVRAHAAWALGEVAARSAGDTRETIAATLGAAAREDADAHVRDEAAAAAGRGPRSSP